MAEEFDVDELVLPDVLGDCKGTLERIKYFFQYLGQFETKMGLMAVVQGQNTTDIQDCLALYTKDARIASIGLPRLLANNEVLGHDIRLRIAEVIRTNYSCDKPIHCLGASYWIEEAEALHRQGIVRGIDTSAPYTAALAQIEMSARGNSYYSRRPNYFTYSPTSFEVQTMARNVRTYLAMAGFRAATPAS